MQRDARPASVVDFGAVGDGATLCTSAFAEAIAAASARGGGEVRVPPGQFLTGAIFLRSHVNLHLEAGAMIVGSQEPEDYPLVESRWEGADAQCHAGLITGLDLEHVTISGRGTIDGGGAAWWRRVRDKTLTHPRPRLINLVRCRHVAIEGVTLRNSPSWTLNPTLCEDVVVDGVTVINPPDSPNTDGINPDSCRNVRITRCYVDVGDDCITIKAGSEGAAVQAPCENIVVSDCVLMHGHGGVVIGSEMSGGVRNVLISNCVFDRTDRGIRIKTRRGRGGVVEDIRVTNVIMRRVSCPITVNMYYRCGLTADEMSDVGSRELQPVTRTTPTIRNIHLSHVTAREIVGAASGFFLGLPESPVTNVTLEDVHLEASAERDPDAASPAMAIGEVPDTDGELFAEHVRDLRLRDVTLARRGGSALRLSNANGIDARGVVLPAAASSGPAVVLTGVSSASFGGARTTGRGEPFRVATDSACHEVRGDESVLIQSRGHDTVDVLATCRAPRSAPSL